MRRTVRRALVALVAIAALGNATRAVAQEQEAEKRQASEVVDTTEGRDLDASQTVRIRITNDLVPTRSVIVSVVGGTRPEYVLGSLLSNETKEWIIDTRPYVGGMRLLATSGARDVRLSRQIDVINFATVRWGLNTDIVRVVPRVAESDTR